MAHFEPDFSMADLDSDFKQFISDIENDGITALRDTMHMLVDKARAKSAQPNGFNNVTYNLRASIGGVIVRNRAIVDTYFPPIGKGDEGRQKGIAYAQELALLQEDDNQLLAIVVAGEFYSVLVERLGKDVISHVISDNFSDEILKLLR